MGRTKARRRSRRYYRRRYAFSRAKKEMKLLGVPRRQLLVFVRSFMDGTRSPKEWVISPEGVVSRMPRPARSVDVSLEREMSVLQQTPPEEAKEE